VQEPIGLREASFKARNQMVSHINEDIDMGMRQEVNGTSSSETIDVLYNRASNTPHFPQTPLKVMTNVRWFFFSFFFLLGVAAFRKPSNIVF
jgi:hypothetical protein